MECNQTDGRIEIIAGVDKGEIYQIGKHGLESITLVRTISLKP